MPLIWSVLLCIKENCTTVLPWCIIIQIFQQQLVPLRAGERSNPHNLVAQSSSCPRNTLLTRSTIALLYIHHTLPTGVLNLATQITTARKSPLLWFTVASISSKARHSPKCETLSQTPLLYQCYNASSMQHIYMYSCLMRQLWNFKAVEHHKKKLCAIWGGTPEELIYTHTPLKQVWTTISFQGSFGMSIGLKNCLSTHMKLHPL